MSRRITLILLIGAAAAIATPFILYGCASWNERLRMRDAEPAFRPIESLGCRIYSQPCGTRYCRYVVEFPPESSLSDTNIGQLASLNKLPKQNTLDLVIETEQVTDRSVAQLKTITTIDLLIVVDSGMSDDGIALLRKEMPGTEVSNR